MEMGNLNKWRGGEDKMEEGRDNIRPSQPVALEKRSERRGAKIPTLFLFTPTGQSQSPYYVHDVLNGGLGGNR